MKITYIQKQYKPNDPLFIDDIEIEIPEEFLEQAKKDINTWNNNPPHWADYKYMIIKRTVTEEVILQ